MTDIISRPRANRHGSACPDWCHIDHAKVNEHTGQVIGTHISAAMGDGLEYPRVTLLQDGALRGNAPQVHVSALPGFVFVSPQAAQDLADLVESLADCSPERIRALADEIRAAAAVIA